MLRAHASMSHPLSSFGEASAASSSSAPEILPCADHPFSPAPGIRFIGWGVWVLFSLLSFVAIRWGISALSESMHLRPDYDANIYHIIGSAWLRGESVPYVGLMDIKGPLIFLECGLGGLLTPVSFAAVALLNALVAGLGLLYACRTAQLFLSRGGALALTGFLFLYTIYFSVHPSVTVLTLQYITLFWLMRWAVTGQEFGGGRLYALGAFAAMTLVLKFNLAVFWGPIGLLVLVAERRRGVLRVLLLMAGGLATVLLPFLAWFWQAGALGALWNEYVMSAVSYGSVPFSECALVQQHVFLLSQMMPDHFAMSAPAILTVPAGLMLALPWVALARVTRLRHSRAVMGALAASFFLCIYAVFGGKWHFLHYFFTFLPWGLLSLITLALWCAPRVGKKLRWLSMVAGWLMPFAVCGAVMMVPWYVNHCKPEKGLEQWRQSTRMMVDLLQEADRDFLCVDVRNLLHLYRLTETCPQLEHFIPQMTAQGQLRHEEELVACIRSRKPYYLIGTRGWEDKMEELTRKAGVDYEPLNLHRMGFPEAPPTADNPPMILWKRMAK